MPKPCKHPEIDLKGKPYEMGSCRLCWLYSNDERYRRLWDEAPAPPAPIQHLPAKRCGECLKQKGRLT